MKFTPTLCWAVVKQQFEDQSIRSVRVFVFYAMRARAKKKKDRFMCVDWLSWNNPVQVWNMPSCVCDNVFWKGRMINSKNIERKSLNSVRFHVICTSTRDFALARVPVRRSSNLSFQGWRSHIILFCLRAWEQVKYIFQRWLRATNLQYIINLI